MTRQTLIATTAMVLLTAGAAIGQHSKLDIGSRARLRAARTAVTTQRTPGGMLRLAPRSSDTTIRAFVTLADGADASALVAAGATVRSVRGSMALAEFPESILADIEALAEVKAIRTETPVSARLDRARAVSGIDKIHAGIDLQQSYTGRGVVAGMFDGGFDPNHVNFKKADGTSRIEVFTYYRPTQSGDYVEEVYTSDYIPNIDTESEETFHGTHTLGIMAGSYRGEVTAAVKDTEETGHNDVMANPYYGVALDADLALACGPESDYFIASGCEQILNYAYAMQRPAVINLSLGSNVGPHDGSSPLCQYIDMVSELDPVIFCLSSGNEGDYKIAINKTFTEESTILGTFFNPYTGLAQYPNLCAGLTYVYSDDDTPFTIQAILFNRSRGRVSMIMPLAPPSREDGGASKYWVTDASQALDGDIVSAQLAQQMTGYIGLNSEWDENTGRYYAVIDCSLYNSPANNGNYILGFQVVGAPGQRVDVFGDGQVNTFTSFDIMAFTDGDTDGTISDVACGHSSIAVGSYNTRDDFASVDGWVYGYQNRFAEGAMSSFTSYGTLVDGRSLPTVCAPGASIISSSNEYYLDAAGAGADYIQAELSDADRHYSWHQCVGTSMASPLVAGSIALWLEADPTLRYPDVQDIIRSTATVDNDVLTTGCATQWGAGKFDAYAGLREVLRRASSGVDRVGVDASRPLVTVGSNRSIGILCAGAASVAATLHDMQGRLAADTHATGDSATLDVSTLPAGVYVLSVNGNYKQKLFIK